MYAITIMGVFQKTEKILSFPQPWVQNDPHVCTKCFLSNCNKRFYDLSKSRSEEGNLGTKQIKLMVGDKSEINQTKITSLRKRTKNHKTRVKFTGNVFCGFEIYF